MARRSVKRGNLNEMPQILKVSTFITCSVLKPNQAFQ